MTQNSGTDTTMVLGFPDSEAQAGRLALSLGLKYATIALRRFPDGESYVRLPETVPRHVILLRALTDANERLVELLLAAHAARDNGAARISLVAPYLCYMRQDAQFNPGEAVSQRIVGKLLSDCFDDVLAVDPHLHRTPDLSRVIPSARTCSLTAASLINDYLTHHLQQPAVIIGPDAESEQWARRIAEPTGLDYCIATKTRFGDRDVDINMPRLDIKDRTVVVIDDISSSGQTLIQAALQLKDEGYRHLYAIVTHALMDKKSMQALHDAGFEAVWSTDTLPHETNVIAIDPVLAEGTQRHLLNPA